ncbi:MAG: hypothetical protein LW875_01065 [Proteobacteria bacterium]|jgi:hypothetical protein|nr:hypothetical protein [Pseudomonadota bacterium]
MVTQILLFSVAIFCSFNLEARSRAVCESSSECQDAMSKVLVQSHGLSSSNQKRVSNTGAVFIRDTSVPALGEAFRDPSGLIWGDIVRAQDAVKLMNGVRAEDYCQAAGVRLPESEEFERLAEYLGQGTSLGYSPFLADGKTDFLSGLSDNFFWSGTASGFDVFVNRYVFYGADGGIRIGHRFQHLLAVRCVSGP